MNSNAIEYASQIIEGNPDIEIDYKMTDRNHNNTQLS